MSTTPQPSNTGRGAQFARVVAIVGGLLFLLPGLWAFVAPESFFENAATFAPYNEHLIRDIGVFQIGLGAVLLLAAFVRDGMLAALAGASVGAVAHVVAHVIDRDLGGDPAVDLPTFGIVALLLIAGALAKSRVPEARGASGPVASEGGEDRWLDGAHFSQFIACPPEHVWDYLLAIDRTPEWRTHLHAVAWADAGPVGVGSRINVTTSLLWYRNVRMVCEVTRFDPEASVFAYRVVDGPATTENEYRVRAQDEGTRFEMKGRLLLDSRLIRLTAPALKFAEDRLTRREVKRLKRLLEDSCG